MRALKELALLCILGATGFCCAASAEEPALQGVFTNPTQSEEPIKAAIETAVKDFNFVVRPVARGRLKKTNSTLKRVEFAPAGKNVTIKLGSGNPTTTEPGRPPIKWTRDDGDIFDVATEWQGSILVQTFSTSEGKRTNSFALSPDGSSLAITVVVSSPQLKAPIKYELTFRRE